MFSIPSDNSEYFKSPLKFNFQAFPKKGLTDIANTCHHFRKHMQEHHPDVNLNEEFPFFKTVNRKKGSSGSLKQVPNTRNSSEDDVSEYENESSD